MRKAMIVAAGLIWLAASPVPAAAKVASPTCVLDGLTAEDRAIMLRTMSMLAQAAADKAPAPPPIDEAAESAGKRVEVIVTDCTKRNSWTKAQSDQVTDFTVATLAVEALERTFSAKGVAQPALERAWAKVTPQDRRALSAQTPPNGLVERLNKVLAEEKIDGESQALGRMYLEIRYRRTLADAAVAGP